MNVSLTPQLEQLVQDKVASGLYTSASEVIREALRLLEQHDRERAIRLQEISEKVDQGLLSLREGRSVRIEAEKLPEFFEQIKQRRPGVSKRGEVDVR